MPDPPPVETPAPDAGPAAAPPAEPVLDLADVTIESADGYDSGLVGVTLALRPGELCLVRVEGDAPRLPLADAACGLVDPDRGAVRFGGADWCQMGFAEACRARGRIGRVFEGAGWVANLDVDENIVLAQRHHTRRPESELVREAEGLARAFGLPGLPRTRPAQTSRQDLARAGLVRAFMGGPRLLLLEQPEAGAFPDVMPALADAVRVARRTGAAVLWLTSNAEVWRDPGLGPTARRAMAGPRVTGEA